MLSFTLFISLFIGVVADEMQLGSSQEKVYEYADSHANHQRVRGLAAEVITQFVQAKTWGDDAVKPPWYAPYVPWEVRRKRPPLEERAKLATQRLGSLKVFPKVVGGSPGKKHTLMRNMSLLIVKAQTGSAYGFKESAQHGDSGVSLKLLARFRRVLELHTQSQGRARPTQYEKQSNAMYDSGQQKRAKFPTSKAHISAVFHSFRLIFGRAISSWSALEAWALFRNARARGIPTLKRR